ncbi:MAG: NAD-dependent malic enzyme [Synechococcales cyanobacterium CRU_2_2]|nr:NAD-dependent malic enzyme [Synechococcales cyanobacterium CRU_2_2]
MVELTPNPSFSVKMRVQGPNRAGMLAGVVEAIATARGSLSTIDLIEQTLQVSVRDLVVDAYSEAHAAAIITAVQALPDVDLLGFHDRTFQLHQGGKIVVGGKQPLKTASDLAMAYTPGVGRICQAIAADPERSYELTIKGNTVAIVSDGSAVLGLGNLGAAAAMPVMEGKALLFKEFAGVDAFPICLDTQDINEIVETVKRIAPVFGGVNLEDIAAPRCFEIEARLRAETDILIFHDDQHGTAIVVLAALTNALKLVAKSLSEVRIVINGAGAAGMAIAKLLQEAGATQIIVCDSKGILSKARTDLNSEKQAFAVEASGFLADAMQQADVFLGVSAPGVLTVEMVATMAEQAIVFAMANPIPEIQPEKIRDHVAIIATGRSDYPNQINNVLAFPGVFRGALDCRATSFTESMYLGAAAAIASLVEPAELAPDLIVPSVFDPRVAPAVAEAVRQVAIASGMARIKG